MCNLLSVTENIFRRVYPSDKSFVLSLCYIGWMKCMCVFLFALKGERLYGFSFCFFPLIKRIADVILINSLTVNLHVSDYFKAVD